MAKARIAGNDCDPSELDDGIRDTVVLLWEAGFKTFTSCEGGRGHSFRNETIGLELDEGFAVFQKRLVKFLRSQGMGVFSISLKTDYHPDCPEGKSMVYLDGLDILSKDKRKRVLKSSKRRERKVLRQLRELGIEVKGG